MLLISLLLLASMLLLVSLLWLTSLLFLEFPSALASLLLVSPDVPIDSCAAVALLVGVVLSPVNVMEFLMWL